VHASPDVRYLSRRHAELLAAFQTLVEATALET
jgi:hypothetical protein